MSNTISIIVPMYNSENTIEKCLTAIYKNKPDEVIVVDDNSNDNSLNIAKKFPCKIIKLKKNYGPAKARNIGANSAKGDILFFVDSDVLLKPHVLKYIKNSSSLAVVGMYAKEPGNKSMFNYYMALRKYFNFQCSDNKFTHITGSCSAINKKLFLKLGGFPERYKGADVEDYALGYLISKKTKIEFNPNIQGFHFFPTFKQCVKNYYKRSSQWIKLFKKRKKFDKGAASLKNALGVFVAIFSMMSMILIPFVPGVSILSAMFFLILFILINLDFYIFVNNERGVGFLFYSFLMDFILSIPIMLGTMRGVLK